MTTADEQRRRPRGRAGAILVPLRGAATHVDGTFAWCLVDHASALTAHDPVVLDEVARRFEAHGALLLAAETSAEAALAHTALGHPRPARASATRASLLRNRCEASVSLWLVEAAVGVPLDRVGATDRGVGRARRLR